MQVDHTHFHLPPSIGPLHLHPLAWHHFKAPPPHHPPYLAHIYWSVNYEFASFTESQPTVNISVHVRPKSWKVIQGTGLLRHEYGHYLIGCLCGLSFAKKVNFDVRWNPSIDFGSWCKQMLSQCLKEYCEMQRLYDEQTNHYLNQQMQARWQTKIRNQLIVFYQFFKNKQSTPQTRAEHNTTKLNNQRLMNAAGSNKIKVRNTVYKKLSMKKQAKSQIINFTQKQLSLSKNSMKAKIANKIKTEVGGSMTNVLSKIRYYKKLQENEAHRAPYIKKSLLIPPPTHLAKPL